MHKKFLSLWCAGYHTVHCILRRSNIFKKKITFLCLVLLQETFLWKAVLELCVSYMHSSGTGRSVGIVTGYGLDTSGDGIAVEVKFFAPVHTYPGAHPASCTVGTESFPG
jgi:hypothetical protein